MRTVILKPISLEQVSPLNRGLLEDVTPIGLSLLFPKYIKAREEAIDENATISSITRFYHIASVLKAISRYSQDSQMHKFDKIVDEDLWQLAALPPAPPYKEWAEAQGGKLNRIGIKAWFYDRELFLDSFINEMSKKERLKYSFEENEKGIYTGVVGNLTECIFPSIYSRDDSNEIAKIARDGSNHMILYQGHSGIGSYLYKTFINLARGIILHKYVF